MKKIIFIIILLILPVVIADEEVISYSRFQVMMAQQTGELSSMIDDKYLLFEDFSNEAVSDVKKQIDKYVDTILLKLITGLLVSYILGAVIVLLFVNWYLRRFYRSKWQ